MDCGEKRLLLKRLMESNDEYREALARCRICRSCLRGETTCQLDAYLAKSEEAHQQTLLHIERHGC